MSKDHEYIKEMFDSDGVKAPESLSEDNMLAMLKAAEETAAAGQKETVPSGRYETRRAKARPSFKRLAALAAVAFVAVVGISGLNEILASPPDTSVVEGELYTFQREKDIRTLIRSLDDNPRYRRFSLGRNSAEEEVADYETYSNEDSATGTVSDSAAAKSADAGGHSETYLQVDEVDEADIVKTDGRYIYYVTSGREVVILSAENGKTKKVSTIGSSGIENYINDIYIKGDRLITTGTIFRDDSDEGSSGIIVYDISDRSKPEVLYDFSQSGSILSSRMVGDYVYLVTTDYVYPGGRTVPLCGGSEDLRSLDVSDICCVPEPGRSSYIVLSAVDISSGKQGRSATKAILGASDQIYCNDHNLYCTSMEWSEDSGTYYTRIIRAGLDGLNVKFDATSKVRGYVDSQFSMDERDGYLRIATTSDRAGINVNNLYILDSKLKETGKVTGFARNESIKAVRYIGDKAYVITYEAIDPLFVIDLSEPADPRIEGEVKIDGFSTLLIPVSSSRLLGIGHATGDNGYGGEYDSGLKLALFDISDPSEPKVLDSKEFRDMSSMAQYDHHALMVNRDDGYFAVPYDIWHYSAIDEGEVFIEEDAEEAGIDASGAEDPVDGTAEGSYETGVLLFKAGDSISSVDKHALGAEAIMRSVYIGEWVYALDSYGNVQSFIPDL